jgi:hypothetical protein
MASIFSGILLPFIVFFVPETAFNREVAVRSEAQSYIDGNPTNGDNVNVKGSNRIEEQRHIGHHTQGWGPFIPQLRLFTRRKGSENIFKILLRPFPLMLHPGVLWGCLTQGTLIIFIVSVATIMGIIL